MHWLMADDRQLRLRTSNKTCVFEPRIKSVEGSRVLSNFELNKLASFGDLLGRDFLGDVQQGEVVDA